MPKNYKISLPGPTPKLGESCRVMFLLFWGNFRHSRGSDRGREILHLFPIFRGFPPQRLPEPSKGGERLASSKTFSAIRLNVRKCSSWQAADRHAPFLADLDANQDREKQKTVNSTFCGRKWPILGPPFFIEFLGGAPEGATTLLHFSSSPDPLFKASKAPFLTLRVATPSGAPREAPRDF